MKTLILVSVNVALLGFLAFLMLRRDTLSYYKTGRIWLTWLAVAVITLMDELTSVFYAPAEAFRFIGPAAIVFIAFTAFFVHYMTTRFVEIAEILEHHKIFGGGVYSFSYFVLGPTVSFVAVASIMVDYILTACISAVSAVENAGSFFSLPHYGKMAIVIAIIWSVAGLNIIGIKENARFTFGIFILAAVVFADLIIGGVLSLDPASIARLGDAVNQASQRLEAGALSRDYGLFIASMASCILAYSGVESVLQTAGLVRTWREIGRAYLFLACTVGIVTPVVAALALSAPIDFSKHQGDLITHYATIVNGAVFGVLMATLASLTLIMAVNTAFVASSELLERVADRYGFAWLIATNKKESLYRIHVMNASFFSCIILITHGSQNILAEMYAIGLVASFCINMGSLLIYRYFMGTKEIIHFYTSRLLTLVMWLILVSCFFFLAWMKPHGTELWAVITTVVLIAGLVVAKSRGPEIKTVAETDAQMSVVLSLAESPEPDLHIFFHRPREQELSTVKANEAFVTFYSPRHPTPPRLAPNHFRLVVVKRTIYQHMVALLRVLEFELPGRQIHVHIGWPLSSWLDRLSIGVMVFKIMRLPRQFENIKFTIHYPGRPYIPKKSAKKKKRPRSKRRR